MTSGGKEQDVGSETAMKAAGEDARSLRQFFSRYAELSTGPTPQELATSYAPHFIVAGPQGSMMFANDQRFLEWLTQVHEFNETHGMRSLAALAVHERVLSPLHTLATVKWGAQFAATGDRPIEFEISYLLERSGDDWKILSYVSERDQAEEMKRLGLL